MALTTEETIALFNILGVPYASTRYELYENGLTYVAREVEAAWSARVAIEAWLADMDVNVLAVLKSALGTWVSLGFSSIRMEAGSVGPITGMTSDPREKRAEIIKQVTTLVPFVEAHKRTGTAGGDSINVEINR